MAIADCTETSAVLISVFSYTDKEPDGTRNFTFFVFAKVGDNEPSREATMKLFEKATSTNKRTCASKGIVNVRVATPDEGLDDGGSEGSLVGWIIAVVIVILSILAFVVFSVRRERAIAASRRQLKHLVEMELAPAPPIDDLGVRRGEDSHECLELLVGHEGQLEELHEPLLLPEHCVDAPVSESLDHSTTVIDGSVPEAVPIESQAIPANAKPAPAAPLAQSPPVADGRVGEAALLEGDASRGESADAVVVEARRECTDEQPAVVLPDPAKDETL